MADDIEEALAVIAEGNASLRKAVLRRKRDGQPIAQIAARVGVARSTIYAWLIEAEAAEAGEANG